jgi:hypothetical protein
MQKKIASARISAEAGSGDFEASEVRFTVLSVKRIDGPARDLEGLPVGLLQHD